jgi:hypothetical protein
MPVAMGDADAVRMIDGVTVPVCSTQCAATFDEDPAGFALTVAATAAQAQHQDHG